MRAFFLDPDRPPAYPLPRRHPVHYKLRLEYDGTNYHGWQIQPKGATVQGTLEAGLSRILNTPIRVQVAGRTDAGVHALGQVATFQSGRPLNLPRFRHSLNAVLPSDIAVHEISEVPDTFQPRYDAHSRTYQYRMWNQPYPSAIHARYSWHIPHSLDRGAMNAAATLLIGHHDFSSFQGADSVERTPWRTMIRSAVCREQDFLVYTVEARSFLRHMVRNIVGTLVDVGRGALSEDEFAAVFAAHDRSRAGLNAPPQGLFLVMVKY